MEHANRKASVLPDPAILKKLTLADPDAAKWVFDRFEKVGEERMKRESLLSTKAFRAGFLRPFRLMTGIRADFDFHAQAWEKTGNNLRKAISDYCEAHPDTVKVAGLTAKDMAALEVTRDAKIYNSIPEPEELRI